MKKLKQFERQEEKDLTEFLENPCEIDKEMYYHIICGYVSPSYSGNDGIAQAGEPEKNVDGVYYFMTVSHINGKYWYLGVLPEFKI